MMLMRNFLGCLIFFTAYVAGSPLVGSKQCTWGPSYWCSHIDHAKECGAVQHCLQTVWQNQVIQVQSTETCTYCMLLVGQLRSALQDKATEDEIAKGIADACALLPAGTDREVCKGIVKDDLPIVMQILLSKITPSMACYSVGFCSVPDEKKPVAELTTRQTTITTAVSTTAAGPQQCQDCMKFINDLKNAVTSNETVSQLKQIIDAVICQHLGPFAQECDDLVAQGLPLALGFLADQVDADKFCRIIGFCVFDGELRLKLPFKNVFANRPPFLPLKYKSSEECEICKDFFTQIIDILRDKTYTDKAKYFIENEICSKLGSLTDDCKQLVEEYFPQLVELLVNELDPTTVCESVGMCKVPGGKLNLQPVLKMLQPSPVTSNGFECEICESVAKQLEGLLEQNATEQSIRDMLDQVCKRLPDKTLTNKCDDLVKKYEDDIIKFLLEEFDPKKMCTALGFCSKNSKEVNKTPSETKDYKLKDDAKCELCKFAIQFVQSALRNLTTEEIIDDVGKVCKYIPNANLSAMCTQYLKEYGPFVIDLLKTSQPEVICGLAKMCGTGKTDVPMFMVPIPEDPVKKTEKETVSTVCEICDSLVFVIKELVDQNMTKEEIKEELKSLCDKIPYLGKECDLMIGLYGDEIIDFLLKEVDPYTCCKKLGLCKASKLQAAQPLMAGILTPLDTLPLQMANTAAEKPVTGETSCVLCKTVLNSLDDILEQKSSQESIQKALESVCKDILPDTITTDCVDFVDKYTPVVLNYIVLNLDADVICKVAKLCPTQKTESVKLVHVPLMKDTTALSRNLGAKSSDIECEVCEQVMTKLDKLIGDKKTEENIKAALQKVCTELPSSIATECKDLVEEYGDIVLTMILQKLKPEQICKTLGFCDKAISRELNAKSSDIECTACEMVMKELITLIGTNKSEESIKAALDKVCSLLPASYEGKCKDLVKEYEDLIVKLLQTEISPEEICTQLGFCSQKYMQPLVASVHLIPSKSSSETAKSKKIESKASTKCVICEFVMKEVDNILGKNKTEANIIKALDKVCDVLPTTVSDECKSFVNEYGKLVVQLLLQELDPEQICTALGLCSQADVQRLSAISHLIQDKISYKSAASGSVQCELCEEAAKYLKNMLDSNTTQEQLEDLLDKMCDLLPDTVTAQCHAVVQQYVPAILDLLKEDINTTQFCQTLGLCSSKGNLVLKPDSVPLTKLDDALYFKPGGHMLGEDDCTYGPSFWCKDEQTAKRCKAWEHCQRHVWNRD